MRGPKTDLKKKSDKIAETAVDKPSRSSIDDLGSKSWFSFVSRLVESRSSKESVESIEDHVISDYDADSSWLAPVLKYIILGLICIMAFSIRLFAIVRWESVIHEFDPYFNFRTTKYLSSEGFYDFLNWYDDRSWYPLGRVVGGTIYPGLMATAASIHAILNTLNISINVRNACVFLAPAFAAITAISVYLFTKEATKRSSTGLLAACLVAIVPSYISRSVAGSYDNEGVAIFALIFTFYLWIKSINTGSIFWSCLCALAYFYMVAAWGGYVFIINIIPIYVVIIVLAGRYSSRLYIAYSVFYTLGSLLAMQVPFVGFNVVKQAECAASHGVFALLQVYAFVQFLQSKLSQQSFRYFLMTVAFSIVVLVAVVLIGLQLSGKTQWTGRSLTLLDPTYAKKYIPIIASVSEHQPTAWTSFFFDLHISVPLAPVGLLFLFEKLSDSKIFVILYGTIAWYFAGVMVRLMLPLAPAACILGAVGLSSVLHIFGGHFSVFLNSMIEFLKKAFSSLSKEEKAELESTPIQQSSIPPLVSLLVGCVAVLFTSFYVMHSTYVASEAYSSPSIVLASKKSDGGRVIFDDFREAYYWLRANTDENAKVMSWWDYGYQISAIANRSVLVDNNTWNNTHIATVGRAMSSREEDAYPIMRSLDVDYVLAIFGGYTGYSSDDINKFLWMVRIGGGVFPHIKEMDYYGEGQYRTDNLASQTMLNCLMYKISFYRFDEVSTEYGRPSGFDRARGTDIGYKGYKLDYVEEAFTSEHWIVRIFKVKKPVNLIPTMNAQSVVQKNKQKQVPASSGDATPNPVFLGCFLDENTFGTTRVYGGGSTGANIGLAKHFAISRNKKYFAVAKAGNDGHSFAFDFPNHLTADANGGGCERPCQDEPSKYCGCTDDSCTSPPPRPVENYRRWAVYEIPVTATEKAKKSKS